MEFQTGQDKVSNAPVPRDKLIELIERCYVAAGADLSAKDTPLVDRFLNRALEQLVALSSQYKYIISMTGIDGDPKNDELSMSNVVGSAWNAKKDGFYNYTLTNEEERFLVTVFWISK